MLRKRNLFADSQRFRLGVLLALCVTLTVAVAVARLQARGEPAVAAPAPAGDTTEASSTVAGAPPLTPAPPVSTATATPAPEPPAPSAALADPAQALREGRYEVAAAGFRAAADAAADPLVRSEALLGAGSASWEAGDADAAFSSLRAALAAAPAGSGAARRAALALGLRLDEASRAAEAAPVLAPFACRCAGESALQPYIEAAFARAAAAAGDNAAADAAWDALLAAPALPGGMAADVFGARATAARARGDRPGYLRWLARDVEATNDPVHRLELASALRDTDPAGADAQLQAILASSPASPVAMRALTALKAAGVAVEPAREGLVDYRQGRYDDAIAVLEGPSRDPARSAADRTFLAFYLAASYEDSNRAMAAVREYDRAAATGASSPYVHRARYWAARVSENDGDAAGAAARYLALATEGPAGEFSTEAAFRAGFTLLQAGNARAGLAAWERLPAAAHDARVSYWAGRAHEALGEAGEARKAFEAAVAAGPRDFHGQQAAQRLGAGSLADVRYRPRALAGPAWAELAALAPAGAASAAPVPAAAGEFAAIGMPQRAAAVLIDAGRSASAAELVSLAKEAERLHLPAAVLQLGFRLRAALGIAPGAEPPALLRLLYPLEYTGTLDQEARRFGVDPLFLAALVRQESAWDSHAGSGAGALGLTQVIPPTGEAIARALGRGFSTRDLFQPATSLEFGAYYISGQLGRYGDPFRALAAYNAGPGNADRWSRRGFGDGADYVEAIDIGETSHYVAVVMEHYAHYVAAYGD